jgi:hypothetical protein
MIRFGERFTGVKGFGTTEMQRPLAKEMGRFSETNKGRLYDA